jgi:hypothetical protein
MSTGGDGDGVLGWMTGVRPATSSGNISTVAATEVEDVVDNSFVEAALAKLGPWNPR